MSTEPAGPVGNANDLASVEQRARRRLVAEKGFYVHLVTYVAVISALFIINALTGSGRWWFVWPAIGWGIGIAVHALATFGLVGLLGRDWEDRRLKELMDEEQRRQV
jgi:2TM domain